MSQVLIVTDGRETMAFSKYSRDIHTILSEIILFYKSARMNTTLYNERFWFLEYRKQVSIKNKIPKTLTKKFPRAIHLWVLNLNEKTLLYYGDPFYIGTIESVISKGTSDIAGLVPVDGGERLDNLLKEAKSIGLLINPSNLESFIN
jgi:hypothetical protein